MREFDWTLQKLVVAPPTPQGINDLGIGERASVDYKLKAVHTEKADTFRVNGNVCVTNTGPFATQNFKITDQLQAKVGSGSFTTFQTFNVNVNANPVLDQGVLRLQPYLRADPGRDLSKPRPCRDHQLPGARREPIRHHDDPVLLAAAYPGGEGQEGEPHRQGVLSKRVQLHDRAARSVAPVRQ